MIDATRQWLATRALRSETKFEADRQTVDTSTTDQPSVVELSLQNPESPQSRITERPVYIPAGATLFGIVTEPRTDEKRRRAVYS